MAVVEVVALVAIGLGVVFGCGGEWHSIAYGCIVGSSAVLALEIVVALLTVLILKTVVGIVAVVEVVAIVAREGGGGGEKDCGNGGNVGS